MFRALYSCKKNISLFHLNNELLLLGPGAEINFLVDLIGLLDIPKLSSEELKKKIKNNVVETNDLKLMEHENQTFLFHQCRFVPPAELIRALNPFLDKKLNDIDFIPIPSNNVFLIILPKEKVKFFNDIIKVLDRPGKTKNENQNTKNDTIEDITSTSGIKFGEKSIVLIHAVYVPSAELIRALNPFQDKILNDVDLVPIPSNNSFMIISPKEKVKFFKDIIKILDSPGITKSEYEKASESNSAEITSTYDLAFEENSIRLIHTVYVSCNEIIRTLASENKINNKDKFCPLPTTNGILIIAQKENLNNYLILIKKIDIPSVSK